MLSKVRTSGARVSWFWSPEVQSDLLRFLFLHSRDCLKVQNCEGEREREGERLEFTCRILTGFWGDESCSWEESEFVLLPCLCWLCIFQSNPRCDLECWQYLCPHKTTFRETHLWQYSPNLNSDLTWVSWNEEMTSFLTNLYTAWVHRICLHGSLSSSYARSIKLTCSWSCCCWYPRADMKLLYIRLRFAWEVMGSLGSRKLDDPSLVSLIWLIRAAQYWFLNLRYEGSCEVELKWNVKVKIMSILSLLDWTDWEAVISF